jgi:DNA-directed RNA polymerase alpha subunit
MKDDELEELRDKVEGLSADLYCAVEVAYKRGAAEWTRLNYPRWFDQFQAAERLAVVNADRPVADLELSRRAINVLGWQGIATLGNLAATPRSHAARWLNCGALTLSEFDRVLREHGLRWAPHAP